MLLPNRHGSTDSYRYGFQGQEKDDEIKGEGNSLNYKFRMHDPRVGRFFAVDPLAKSYPFFSSYQFAGNSPIANLDREGLENMYYTYKLFQDGTSDLKLIRKEDIVKQTGWTAGNRNTRKPKFVINPETNIYVYISIETYSRVAGGNVMRSGGLVEAEGLSEPLTDGELLGELEGNSSKQVSKSIKQVQTMQMIQAGSAVVSLSSSGAGRNNKPETKVAKGQMAEETVELYRGVNQSHPGFKNALKGKAQPRGGSASPAEHNAGNTKSPFTSWTTNIEVAKNSALRPVGEGTVLRANIPKSQTVTSPNREMVTLKQSGKRVSESEVLVKGNVSGASSTKVKLE